MGKLKHGGRPPAAWMYQIASIDLKSLPSILEYKDICEIFSVSKRAACGFFNKIGLETEFEVRGRYAVRVFRAKNLQQRAKAYLEEQLGEL